MVFMLTALIILSVLTLAVVAAMVVVMLRSRQGGDAGELLRLNTQVAELQSDLRHATEENERIRQEGSATLLQAKADADKRLQETKEEAAAALQQAKEEADKRVQAVRDEQKRHYDELVEQQKANAADSLKTLREHFTEAFHNIKKLTTDATDEMLRQRQSEFSETSQKSIDTILAPLRQQLDIMQKSMTDSRLSQTELKTAMHAEIENLMRQGLSTG